VDVQSLPLHLEHVRYRRRVSEVPLPMEGDSLPFMLPMVAAFRLVRIRNAEPGWNNLTEVWLAIRVALWLAEQVAKPFSYSLLRLLARRSLRFLGFRGAVLQQPPADCSLFSS
jgi:hypothetical protein